jgi:hypothetical protein
MSWGCDKVYIQFVEHQDELYGFMMDRMLHQEMLVSKVALLSMPFLAETILAYSRKGKPVRSLTGGSAMRSISVCLVAGVHDSTPGDCESS